MKFRSNIFHRRRGFYRVVAALALLLFLYLLAMAVCPALHELLHHDANQHGHECAATLFAHGKISADEIVPVLAIVIFALWFGLPSVVAPIIYSFDLRLAFGRAPPLLPAVS